MNALLLKDPAVVTYLITDQIVDDLHSQKLHRRLVICHHIVSRLIGHKVLLYPLHQGGELPVSQPVAALRQKFFHLRIIGSKQFPVGRSRHIHRSNFENTEAMVSARY